jgi:tryptophan synthase alpha chain
VAVGFGVRDAASAAGIAGIADGVVVGSAIVEALRGSLVDGKASAATLPAVTGLVGDIARGVRSAARSLVR